MRLPATDATLRTLETVWVIDQANPWCVEMRAPGRDLLLLSTEDLTEIAATRDSEHKILHASGLTLHRDGEWVWVWPDDRISRLPQVLRFALPDVREVVRHARRLCAGRRLEVPSFPPAVANG
ncbi:MAG TPA: hypothetical protein VN088_14515 [Nocardioides sp.]|nr:hypothetical protein [Nocardioides sp.]